LNKQKGGRMLNLWYSFVGLILSCIYSYGIARKDRDRKGWLTFGFVFSIGAIICLYFIIAQGCQGDTLFEFGNIPE
jgi:hypothetical protein